MLCFWLLIALSLFSLPNGDTLVPSSDSFRGVLPSGGEQEQPKKQTDGDVTRSKGVPRAVEWSKERERRFESNQHTPGFLTYPLFAGRSYHVSGTARALTIDNRPTVLLGGHVDFGRSFPSMWRHLLRQTREAGLNVVHADILWNVQEPTQGQINLSGSADISRFLSLAAEEGLFVSLRLDPLADVYTANRGLPTWLVTALGNKDTLWNSEDPRWMKPLKEYVYRILAIVRPHLATFGGPVILGELSGRDLYMPTDSERRRDPPSVAYRKVLCGWVEEVGYGIPWIECPVEATQASVDPVLRPCVGVDCTSHADNFVKTHTNSPTLWCHFSFASRSWALDSDMCLSRTRRRETAKHQNYFLQMLRYFARGGSGIVHRSWYGGLHTGTMAGNATSLYLPDAFLSPEGFLRSPIADTLVSFNALIREYADILIHLAGEQRDHYIPVQWLNVASGLFENGWEQVAYSYVSGGKSISFIDNMSASPVAITWQGRSYKMGRKSVIVIDESGAVRFDSSSLSAFSEHSWKVFHTRQPVSFQENSWEYADISISQPRGDSQFDVVTHASATTTSNQNGGSVVVTPPSNLDILLSSSPPRTTTSTDAPIKWKDTVVHESKVLFSPSGSENEAIPLPSAVDITIYIRTGSSSSLSAQIGSSPVQYSYVDASHQRTIVHRLEFKEVPTSSHSLPLRLRVVDPGSALDTSLAGVCEDCTVRLLSSSPGVALSLFPEWKSFVVPSYGEGLFKKHTHWKPIKQGTDLLPPLSHKSDAISDTYLRVTFKAPRVALRGGQSGSAPSTSSSSSSSSSDYASLVVYPRGLVRGRAFLNGHDLGRFVDHPGLAQPYIVLPSEWLRDEKTLQNELVFLCESDAVESVKGVRLELHTSSSTGTPMCQPSSPSPVGGRRLPAALSTPNRLHKSSSVVRGKGDWWTSHSRVNQFNKVCGRARSSWEKRDRSRGTLLYECSGWCGGVGDRMKGITVVWYLSTRANTKFQLKWSVPTDLRHFFQSNDEEPWGFDGNSEEYALLNDLDRVKEWSGEDWSHLEGLLREHQHVRVRSNVIWSKQRYYLREMGLAVSTPISDLHRDDSPFSSSSLPLMFPIGCAIHNIMKPTKALSEALSQTQRDLFPDPSRPVIGLHVRIGGARHNDATFLSEDDVVLFIRCAAKIERELGLDAYWYLASDNERVRSNAQEIINHEFPSLDSETNPKLITSSKRVVHMDRGKPTIEDEMFVFVEWLLLASSDALVLSPSGYGESAADIGMVEDTFSYATCERYTHLHGHVWHMGETSGR